MNEQQEIDDYITQIDETWKRVELDHSTKDSKVDQPILDLASFLKSKRHRDICDEVIHLLKDVIAKYDNEPGSKPGDDSSNTTQGIPTFYQS